VSGLAAIAADGLGLVDGLFFADALPLPFDLPFEMVAVGRAGPLPVRPDLPDVVPLPADL
jgi:hypothetical protein